MPFTFTSTGGSGDGTPGANGKDSLFLGTWHSTTAFLETYQGGPVGLADGEWWAFVKDNTDPNKVYVVREDPNSATGWVIDDNESFILPSGADGADGSSTLLKGSFNYFGDLDVTVTNANIGDTYLVLLASAESLAGNLWTWNGTGWTNAGQILGPQGEPGEDGNDGAPGERGISALSWTYKAQTGVVNVDPGNDYLNFNADPFTSSTQIRVDDNPYGLNTTLHDLFLSIQSGYLSVTSQSDPSSYATFEIVSCVDGTATNETIDGSYVIFNVSLVSTYGAISNEDFVTLSLAPAGQQGEPGTPGTPGADALWDYLGEYNGGTTYSAGAVVTYDGQLWYRNVYTSAGYVPGVNNGYWDLLAAKGNNGTSFTSRGAWTDSENYAINDIVTFEGSAYVCIVGVTAGTDVAPYPQNLGAYWNLLISGSTVDTGQITFVGVYIIGAGGGSGDGAGNGTIKLMPDEDLVQQQYHEDQYLIIDPTSPNHIHIRAGGVQDASTADLFLGAERTGVQVSDGSGNVIIRSKNPDLVFNYVNAHTSSTTTFIANTPTAEMNTGDYLFFDSIKYTIGSKLVVGETTEYDALSDANVPMQFIAGANYTFYRNMGEDRWMFQTDGITFPNNTVQTDAFPGGATGTFMSSDNQLITVTNGIITTINSLT
jgi:hypothetical protein